jgi:hypothetical protein
MQCTACLAQAGDISAGILPGKVRFASERPKRDGCEGVLDAGYDSDAFIDEMADIDLVVDIEFGDQFVVSGGGIDLRRDLGLRQFAGDIVGPADLAFELNKEGFHEMEPDD